MVAKKGQREEVKNPPDTERTNEVHNWAQRIRGLQKQYGGMLAAYSKLNPNDPFAVLNWFTRLQTDTLPMDLLEKRNQLIERLNHDIEGLFLAFDASFREECRRHSWKLDGQWPSYYVELFLKIEVFDRARSIKIGEQQLSTAYLPDVIAAVEQQLTSVAVDRIDVDEFISELSAAYDQIASAGHRQPSIWQVYKQFLIVHQRPAFWKNGRLSAFRAYDEQKFRAAFTKMLQRDRVVTPDDRELRIFPPIRAEDGMFLYHPVEGRHAFVGRIELVPKTKEAP